MEEKGNMERLTERTADGILVKEDYGEDVLKTLYQCYGAEPMTHYVNCDEGYCAMEKLAQYEDLEEQGKLLKLPCSVGDTVYNRYDGMKIAPMCVEEIIITEYGTNLLLVYCGSDEKLKYWKINIESTAIDNKIVFITREEAEAALKEL